MKNKFKKVFSKISPRAEVAVEEKPEVKIIYCQNPNCKSPLIEESSQVLVSDYKFFHSSEECQKFAIGNKKSSKGYRGKIHPNWSVQAILRQQDSYKFKYKKLN